MNRRDLALLIDQWTNIYEDHQSMVEAPEERRCALNELVFKMIATGELDDPLRSELICKGEAAYQWALEFKAGGGLY